MKDETWYFISGCLTDMEKQHDSLDGAVDGLMIDPESPLIEPFYKNIDTTLQALSFIAGDAFGSLNWYVYECDYGRKAKEAGRPGEMRLIDTHEKLRWLIDLSNSK